MLETLTSTIRVGSSFLPWCWWKKWWKKSCNHLRIADLTLYISWIPLDTGTHLPVLVPVGVPFRKTLLRDGEFFPPIRWNHVTEGPGTSIFKKYSATSNQPTTTNLQEKKHLPGKHSRNAVASFPPSTLDFPGLPQQLSLCFPGFLGRFFLVPTAGCFLPSDKGWGSTRSASACGHKGSNLKLLTTGKKNDNWEVVKSPKAKGNPKWGYWSKIHE